MRKYRRALRYARFEIRNPAQVKLGRGTLQIRIHFNFYPYFVTTCVRIADLLEA
jgi:hypothetical protein